MTDDVKDKKPEHASLYERLGWGYWDIYILGFIMAAVPCMVMLCMEQALSLAFLPSLVIGLICAFIVGPGYRYLSIVMLVLQWSFGWGYSYCWMAVSMYFIIVYVADLAYNQWARKNAVLGGLTAFSITEFVLILAYRLAWGSIVQLILDSPVLVMPTDPVNLARASLAVIPIVVPFAVGFATMLMFFPALRTKPFIVCTGVLCFVAAAAVTTLVCSAAMPNAVLHTESLLLSAGPADAGPVPIRVA